ncbi:hypothetical protein MAR_001487 [Mya arenaria]|uniref:Protein kinase domain-containing protein n=1 Tax=Mya arenaria TaxID=6604 RepID=A0ABY7FE68_MYAAR|nr:hypothetical protein MAR_001487 [Mya arenaria]
MATEDDTLTVVLFLISSFALVLNILSSIVKLCRDFSNPKLWRYSLLYQNIAYCFLSIGLIALCAFLYFDVKQLCDTAGFCLLFGLFQTSLAYLTTGIILLSIQNPGKPSSLTKFHRNVVIVIIAPEVVIGAVIASLPFVSSALFDTNDDFDVTCFPVRDHGQQGAAFGTLLVAIWWIILAAIIICDIILVLKLWKFNNRVNSAQNNVWQSQLIAQGKTLIKVLLIDHIAFVLVILSITVAIYVDLTFFKVNQTWIVTTSLALTSTLHGVLSNVTDVMWTACCCRYGGVVKEPHRKLKKLELMKIEAPGKLRMKATWTVYGVDHLKSWAQEIVMLGMLRRTQHPSLIQCLWTNSSNPYYETMTLISGDIITSDSRIICLEMTNGGSLQDFLQKCELPLPEPCQRMIVHDIAEGLFYLHHENILHNNLNTSAIYLKGSLQSMVLRAAIGDFEDAQIYGTLQQSFDSSIRDKKYFFLPDIRSFALIALEILGKMCEKKFQNRYVNYNTDHVPLKMNLENVISDEDDEFEAQYCYDAEDTHRMFQAISPDNDEESDESYESDASENDFEAIRQTQGSMANLMDRSRPMSPVSYSGRNLGTPESVKLSNDYIEVDCEIVKYNAKDNLKQMVRPMSPKVRPMSPKAKPRSPKQSKTGANAGIRKGPEVLEPKPERPKAKATSRKARKGISKSSEDIVQREVLDSMQQRSVSTGQVAKDSNRCVSPDPMMDERLQELRNAAKSNSKDGKKDRKFSFRRKKSEENVMQKEAFVLTTQEQEGKRKDGKWLSKPTSILKSITGNDNTVSVFKAKTNDEENHLDAIEEEDIQGGQTFVNNPPIIRTKEKQKAEVWDIIDEQYYKQVNKKAINKLKKTISSESKSSLWSFISTAEDLDDDDLDDILECLPGMTEPEEFRKSEIKVSEIIAEREKATRAAETKKRFTLADLNKSKFELIDYYDMLKTKQITIHDVPEDKREMLLNVVELKKEEKLKREGRFVPPTVLKSDELYDNNMSPGGAMVDTTSGGKVKLVSFRQNQTNSSPQRAPTEPVKGMRAMSAPLKRPRTPLHKPQSAQNVSKTPEVNPAFTDTRAITVAKRNKARVALKRALNNKGAQSFRDRNERDRERVQNSTGDLSVKYATIRKISVNGAEGETDTDTSEVVTVPVPTSDSFSFTNSKPVLNTKDVKRYHSFSSNESGSSGVSLTRTRNPDISFTSGEASSLSSQAESDHYETDMETVSKAYNKGNKNLVKGPSSRVDSGFDSGSMSSEMSDAFMNRNKHLNTHTPINHNKGVLNSWARNYKPVDSLPNSPYNFSNKFIPPAKNHHSGQEKIKSNVKIVSSKESVQKDVFDNRSVDSGFSHSAKSKKHESPYMKSENNQRGRKRNVKKNQDIRSLNMSPVGRSRSPTTSRPLSPPSRPLSPSSYRPLSPDARPMSPNSCQMSPSTRPMSPNVRPTSPISRPLSPNIRHTEVRQSRYDKRSMSPPARVMSPSPSIKPTKSGDSSFAPGRKLIKPPSPAPHHRAKSMDAVDRSMQHSGASMRGRSLSPPPVTINSSEDSSASRASKRYRELVKQGVPMRTSVVEASPTREGNPDLRIVEDTESRPGTADSVSGRPFTAEELYENLEANGFFSNRRRSRSPAKSASPSRSMSPGTDSNGQADRRKDKRKQKQLSLEELVREKPISERKSKATAHRSASKNHLAVSEEAYLNQPLTSEESETCSIKTNKSTNSVHSGAKPKVMVDAEMVIDRIFSQNQPETYEIDVEVEAALGLDKDPFKSVNELYLNDKSPDTTDLDNIPLLNGVNQRHIHGCLELVSGLHVITVRDLLPASKDSFETLRNKLQQLLDVIQKCWLMDVPPSSGDLVEQLTDPVTETEL